MRSASVDFNAVRKYGHQYKDKLVVIKFGGALAEDDKIIESIAGQAAFMVENIKARVIVVHGGGAQIDEALKRNNLEPKRDPKTGLRITDRPTLEVSDAELEKLNGHIVRIFQAVAPDIRIYGMAGYDGPIMQATSLNAFTGQATKVNVEEVAHMLSNSKRNAIPIIYPICSNEKPQHGESRLNVNADDVAGLFAAKMDACRLITCSDIPGVLDKKKKLIPNLSTRDINHLIEDGTVTGGMITKVQAAANAAEALPNGGVVILDGRRDNTILAELLSEGGTGTLIQRPSAANQERQNLSLRHS